MFPEKFLVSLKDIGNPPKKKFSPLPASPPPPPTLQTATTARKNTRRIKDEVSLPRAEEFSRTKRGRTKERVVKRQYLFLEFSLLPRERDRGGNRVGPTDASMGLCITKGTTGLVG